MKQEEKSYPKSSNTSVIFRGGFQQDERQSFDVDYVLKAAGQTKESPVRRVAAYIRVSTDLLDQENSYIAQERYFQKLIAGNPKWKFAGVYSDYGLSGTGTEDRIGFRRIIRHCKEGKIDRILCKSISRFARNTADFSRTILQLRSWGVTIFFEKENLDSAEVQNDFILSVLGAFAQEESRSISSNIKLGLKMRMQQGNVPNAAIYGYRFTGNWLCAPNGYRYKEVEVIEKEAEVVRMIYQKVADGFNFSEIARNLNAKKIPAPNSNYKKARKNHAKKGQLNSNLEDGWKAEQISRIVRNERYAGDVLAQKTFIPDYLTHKVKTNQGEMPQYYIKNHHEAIVGSELYNRVQEVLKIRTQKRAKKALKTENLFFQRLICGNCGRFYYFYKKNEGGLWCCPTAMQNNGVHICAAECVKKSEIARVIHEVLFKDYGLQYSEIYGIVAAKDQEEFATEERTIKKWQGVFSSIIQRLKETMNDDSVERSRSSYREKLAQISGTLQAAQTAIGQIKGQTPVSVQDEFSTNPKAPEKEAFEKLRYRIQQEEKEYARITTKLTLLEEYWRELETDHKLRAEALQWVKKLPKGKNGIKQLLKGITEKYFRAFILEITIYSKEHYSVRWFDDRYTEVVLKNCTGKDI